MYITTKGTMFSLALGLREYAVKVERLPYLPGGAWAVTFCAAPRLGLSRPRRKAWTVAACIARTVAACAVWAWAARIWLGV
jgi:hypothetical protein